MKRLLNRIATLAALVAVAGAVSCSEELASGEPQSEGIRLEFSAALDPSFGPAAAAAQGATPTATQSATRGPIMGVNFPAGTYLIGLAIFKDEYNGTVWTTGYDNIKAEMTVDAYGAQKWRFQPKGSTTWTSYLAFPENTEGDMYITALYPYDAAATISAGRSALESEIDFTTAAEQANQTDAMYSGRQKLTLAAGDRSRAILLQFKHFFAMFEFQIAPMFDTPSRISRIEVTSISDIYGFTNKFKINTWGELNPTAEGPVAVTDTRPMTMGVYNTYRVLVPQTRSLDDGDIVVTFTDDTNLSVAPLSLPIKQEWLNNNGMEMGKRYIFKMLYNNAPTGPGSLTVHNWAVGGEVDDMWGTPTPSQGYICWGAPGLVTSGKFDGSTIKTIPGSTKNSYNGYVNTQANAAGNGGAATWEDELPYYRLEVDKTDVTGTWAEVWTKCKQKAPAGQWRLPRQSELIMMYLNSYGLRQSSNFTPFDGVAQATSYASGSEYFIKELSSYTIRCLAFQDGSIAQGSKDKSTWLARCVREMP